MRDKIKNLTLFTTTLALATHELGFTKVLLFTCVFGLPAALLYLCDLKKLPQYYTLSGVYALSILIISTLMLNTLSGLDPALAIYSLLVGKEILESSNFIRQLKDYQQGILSIPYHLKLTLKEQEIVQESLKLATLAGLSDVKIIINNANSLEAISIYTYNKILINRGLIDQLSQEEILALVAHELVHLQKSFLNRIAYYVNSFFLTKLDKIMMISILMKIGNRYLNAFKGIAPSHDFWFFSLAQSIALFALSFITSKEFGRSEEFRADIGSIHLLKNNSPIQYFKRTAINNDPILNQWQNDKWNRIVHRLLDDEFHPPLAERVAIMEEELKRLKLSNF